MTISTKDGLITDIAGLRDSGGFQLAHTDWQEMTQPRVDEFANVTGDHNFIHVDPERAKDTPFGDTIAHGFLRLTLEVEDSEKPAVVADQLIRVYA